MKKTLNIISHIARTLLGIVFIFSGVAKMIDPLGTTYKIEDYLKAFGGFFTEFLPLSEAAAMCLIVIEVTLGVCMVLHVKTNWTAWLSFAFYCVMTPLTLYIALTNPVSDCGCFGDAVILTNWQTFWKNIMLMLLVVILLITKKYTRPMWTSPVEAGIAVISIGCTLGFMFWTLNHLPIKDFRPYKIGNNIPELMEYPEDAEPDQYAITFVYQKDGEEQEFTLENYPKNDSSWTFVRQKSELIKKGYEPPIHDFELMSMEYEDMTYDILESEDVVTLVIMYDLAKTERKNLDKLDEIDEPCYYVTGSGEADIEAFCQETGLEMSRFLSCDPVTLKTIVRANPGVIVLQNGTIIDKYNLKNR